MNINCDNLFRYSFQGSYAPSGHSYANTSGSTHTSLATSIEYRRGLLDLLRLRNNNVLLQMAYVLLPHSECHLRTMTADALAAMVRSAIADCCDVSRLSKAFGATVASVPKENIGLLTAETQALLRRHRPSLSLSERPFPTRMDDHIPVFKQGLFGSTAHVRQPFSTNHEVEEPKAKPKGPSLRMGGLSL